MGSDDYIEVDVIFVRFTDKAVLVKSDADAEKVWVPRSCLHAASDVKIENCDEDDEITLKLRQWVAEEKGLI